MRHVSADQMASAVMQELEKYRDMSVDRVKEAVDNAAKTVKDRIGAGAPVRTGKYAKSWSAKVTKDDAFGKEITVYSKTQYRLAHLLEHGHAKRSGGRTAAQPHIAPAEQTGIEQLEQDIKRGLRNG